jgi:HEAT repeat protein
LRALIAFLFPHRWKGQLAQAQRLLASEPRSLDGVGQKMDAWLDSVGWEVRNAAVKLIAHVRDESRVPRLFEKLTDRSEAGIVRRNAAEAIARLGLGTDAARSALLEALHDPYWEVRAEAAHALAMLFPPDAALELALLNLLLGPPHPRRHALRERNFEVQMAIAQALGYLGESRRAFDALAELARDDSWPVRSQTAVALAHFAARQPPYLDEARQVLLEIDHQSEGAVSYFVHRDVVSQAILALPGAQAARPPEGFRELYLNPKAGWNHIRR